MVCLCFRHHETTLFQYDSLDTWLDDLPGALGSLGYSVRQERRGLFAYEKTVPTNLEGVVRGDGLLVVRERSEQGECALGVKDHRKYFLESSGEPVRRPEQVLLRVRAAGLPGPAWGGCGQARPGGKSWGGFFRGRRPPGWSRVPLPLGVHEKTMLVPGGGGQCLQRLKSGNCSYNGFNKNPDDLHVLVIGRT